MEGGGGMDAQSARQRAAEGFAAAARQDEPPPRWCWRLLGRACAQEALAAAHGRGGCELTAETARALEEIRRRCRVPTGRLAYTGSPAPLPAGVSGQAVQAAVIALTAAGLRRGGQAAAVGIRLFRDGNAAVLLVVSSGSTAGDRLGQRLGRALARTAGGSFLTAAGGGQVSAALHLPLTDCAPCPPFDPTGQYGTAAGLLWEFGVWD